MLNWGSGSSLGFLTFLGYFVFLLGGVSLWRHRQEFSCWVDNEFSGFRRTLSRHEPSGPFYARRCESRLIVIPSRVAHSVAQLPRRRFSPGAFLLVLGMILFALDFFI